MSISRTLVGLLTTLIAVGSIQAEEPLSLRGKSITVLPPRLEVEGRPADEEMSIRIAEVLGLMLENAGMREVTLEADGWTTAEEDSAAAFSRRVREHPPATDTVLWVRFGGAGRLEQIDWVLCDRGAGVLARSAPPTGARPPDHPMGACLAVAQALRTQSDLGDPSTPPETEGPLARRMRERSGLPPPAEVEAAKARLAALGGKLDTGCAVYPVRVAGPDQADAAVAHLLAERLNAAGLGPATPTAAVDMALDVPGDPNQMKVLWDTARAFRAYLQTHPADRPYALLVECGPVPQVRYVHLFLCERNGDWIAVDMQNSHHADFQSIGPDSVEGCLDLAVLRLASRIRDAAAE